MSSAAVAVYDVPLCPPLLRRAAGHARTIWSEVRPARSRPVAARPVEVFADDPVMGRVRLSGLFGDVAGATTVVIIVPGITGTAWSPYCARAAGAARRAGCAHLRIGMRGTDKSGEDLWHGGLSDDVHAAIAMPELRRFARVVLLGYSVGGHVALRAAAEPIDSRVGAVAALCPPLDLDLGTRLFDEIERRIYRRHILACLDDIYAATAARRSLPVPPEVVRAATSSRERDALAIAPRFGFRSAEDYYARASAAPRLPHLRVPALVVATREDPIVPPRAIVPALAAAGSAVETRWIHGGHLAFDLRTEDEVIDWLERA